MQNPRTTPSGRKLTQAERKIERKNAIHCGQYVLSATPKGNARTSLGPMFCLLNVTPVATFNCGRGYNFAQFSAWGINLLTRTSYLKIKAKTHCVHRKDQKPILKISASADVGPRSRVCARKSLCSAPHQHERKFSGAHVCRVTFKRLPQPLGIPGRLLKLPPLSA